MQGLTDINQEPASLTGPSRGIRHRLGEPQLLAVLGGSGDIVKGLKKGAYIGSLKM